MRLLDFLFGNKTNRINDYLKKDAALLDVRTLKEYNNDHIENAIHIPVANLKSRLVELKTLNKPIIAYCASGVRSAKAAQLLKINGIDAINGGGIATVKSALQ
jgi:phage shock protein E